MLSGVISNEIGNLINLRFLQFDSNQFSGEIPGEIGNAVNLITADFQNNNFRGFMPGSLCALRNPGFRLIRLVSDCGGNIPEVQCACCNECVEGNVNNLVI